MASHPTACPPTGFSGGEGAGVAASARPPPDCRFHRVAARSPPPRQARERERERDGERERGETERAIERERERDREGYMDQDRRRDEKDMDKACAHRLVSV